MNQWILNPKTIFLLDGLGACLTAFLLGVVLTAFNEYFGMPQKTLNILALIALGFAFYSFFCFFFIGSTWHMFPDRSASIFIERIQATIENQ